MQENISNTAENMYKLAENLWSYNRSITGDGVRKTLSAIKKIIPDLQIVEVPSGKKVFNWVVPQEWVVRSAYIKTPDGRKICDFEKNNLHLVGYSSPINTCISLKELKKKLYSLPEMPEAIPYLTSYYKKQWGFCISEKEKDSLPEGDYEVYIDSEFIEGSLTYGEILVKGNIDKEVFMSTYICHPSMANNELSGICVTTFLAKYLTERKDLRYSYRIIFIPETIGSITYLSQNLEILKSNVIAGYNITCVGDDRNFSYLPSRNGNTLSDYVAKHVLLHEVGDYISYEWRDRGSDERQYCWPGIDLPIASMMRTKYGKYKEYHTSLDALGSVVTPKGLLGAYNIYCAALHIIERNCYPVVTTLCEPFLSRWNLYPELGNKVGVADARLLIDILSWCDGKNSVLDIADRCKCYAIKVIDNLEIAAKAGLVNLDKKRLYNN